MSKSSFYIAQYVRWTFLHMSIIIDIFSLFIQSTSLSPPLSLSLSLSYNQTQTLFHFYSPSFTLSLFLILVPLSPKEQYFAQRVTLKISVHLHTVFWMKKGCEIKKEEFAFSNNLCHKLWHCKNVELKVKCLSKFELNEKATLIVVSFDRWMGVSMVFAGLCCQINALGEQTEVFNQCSFTGYWRSRWLYYNS